MRRKMAWLAIALAALGGVVVFWGARPATPDLQMPGLQWFDPPPRLPASGLKDTEGRPFRWDWPQGWTVAFFGYTHCPDFCPDTLAVLARVESQLQDAPPHRVVFVSVDPYRDTAEVIRAYLEYFDDRFIGVTGSPEALQAVTAEAGAFYDYEDPDSGAVFRVPDAQALEKGYVVNHFGALVLVDPDGVMRGHLYPPLNVERVSRLIRALR